MFQKKKKKPEVKKPEVKAKKKDKGAPEVDISTISSTVDSIDKLLADTEPQLEDGGSSRCGCW